MAQTTPLDAVIEAQDAITKSLVPAHVENGVLIPLKTTLELRDDHRCGQVLITRSPIRSTSTVINLIHDMLPEEIVNGMPHLRRCAKPADLPAHLKSQFMNDTATSKQIHTGKSNWVYVMLGLAATLSETEMGEALAEVDGFEDGVFLASIPVPLLAPTSQIQAALWTSQFWPTMYRKNNPLGPHPSMVIRATDDIADDAPIWMALAHDVASKSKAAGYGEAIGACVVYRGSDGPRVVAIAGDARWKKHPKSSKTGNPKSSKTGNPMAHAVLRAVSMVAQKLVLAEKKKQRNGGLHLAADGKGHAPSSEDPVALQSHNRDEMGSCGSKKQKYNDSQEPQTEEQNPEQGQAPVQNTIQDQVRDRLRRNRDRGPVGHRQRLTFEPFQDKSLLPEEDRVFAEEHPTPDGYLCHGLELYVTHEPCAMCSMAILHSRMGKVIFANRMPLTGGLSAEDRVLASEGNEAASGQVGGDTSDAILGKEGIHGLGLFWRRELNWSLLAWEWEPHCSCQPLAIEPTTHA